MAVSGASCDHRFEYRGMVYQVGGRLAGSGARTIIYFDAYYCSGCLAQQFRRTELEHDSYQPILHGATPMPTGIGVTEHL